MTPLQRKHYNKNASLEGIDRQLEPSRHPSKLVYFLLCSSALPPVMYWGAIKHVTSSSHLMLLLFYNFILIFHPPSSRGFERAEVYILQYSTPPGGSIPHPPSPIRHRIFVFSGTARKTRKKKEGNAFLPFIGLWAPLVLLLCSKDHTQIKAPSENGKRSIEKGSVHDPSLLFYYSIISFICQYLSVSQRNSHSAFSTDKPAQMPLLGSNCRLNPLRWFILLYKHSRPRSTAL